MGLSTASSIISSNTYYYIRSCQTSTRTCRNKGIHFFIALARTVELVRASSVSIEMGLQLARSWSIGRQQGRGGIFHVVTGSQPHHLSVFLFAGRQNIALFIRWHLSVSQSIYLFLLVVWNKLITNHITRLKSILPLTTINGQWEVLGFQPHRYPSNWVTFYFCLFIIAKGHHKCW